MNLRKGESSGNLKRMHSLALFGEFAFGRGYGLVVKIRS